MTIDALRRLVELLTDTAGYAAAVDQSAIAADLTQGAAAARRLLDDEQRAVHQTAANSRRSTRTRRPAPARS